MSKRCIYWIKLASITSYTKARISPINEISVDGIVNMFDWCFGDFNLLFTVSTHLFSMVLLNLIVQFTLLLTQLIACCLNRRQHIFMFNNRRGPYNLLLDGKSYVGRFFSFPNKRCQVFLLEL